MQYICSYKSYDAVLELPVLLNSAVLAAQLFGNHFGILVVGYSLDIFGL
jgi:hypothetical protein